MWKLQGIMVNQFDSGTVMYNILADAFSDLPTTVTDIGYGTTLGYGSMGKTINDSKSWKWNGTAWIEQKTGQEIEIGADDIIYDNTDSGLTAENVQDAIDELKDENDTQDSALTELYGEDASLQLQVTYAIDTGVKNIFETTATDYSTRNCDFTVNSDGSFGVHTTAATDAASNTFMIGAFTPKETAQYVITTGLSSAATGGDSSSTFCLQMRTGDGSAQGSIVARIAQTWTGTLEANTTYHLRFYFASGQTISEVCQPMVKKAIIKSTTWEPYAPTNRELYEMILALNNGTRPQVQNRQLSLSQNVSNLNLNQLNLNHEALDSNYDLREETDLDSESIE